MSPDDPVDALERAILERARALAEEHLSQAHRSRERILEASTEKLRSLEEREVVAVKARAEREYRRRVQASELRLQGELDRLRWALVQSVMEDLNAGLTAVHADEASYLPLFKSLLAQAAKSIEREALVATVNAEDHRQFAECWDGIAREAAPEKQVTLSSATASCTGGVLVTSQDNRIRVDNTFEGRIERLEPVLQRVILERLFPSALHMGLLFSG